MSLSPQENVKIAKYEELLANEPNTLVFAALGSLYARQYNFERAVEVLDNGLRYFPNYFSARVLLAKCYLALNLFDAAIAELEKVIEVDPNNVSALALIGDEHRNRGRADKARAFYKKVLDLDPNNEEFQYKLHLLDETVIDTVSAFQTGDTALTQRGSGRSIGDEPDTEGEGTTDLATITLARIYIDQGLISKAQEILDIIVKRDPDNREAAELREHLDLANASGKITAPTVRKIATKLEAVERNIEKDEFDIDLVDRLREASANLSEALKPVFTPQPNGGTSGIKSYELAYTPKGGDGGGENLVMSDSLAELFMVEFSLPEISVLAGELGINEIVLTEQLSIGEDEFVIDTGEIAHKIDVMSDTEINEDPFHDNDLYFTEKQKDIGDHPETSGTSDTMSNRSTQKLQPEDIFIYKPNGLDFEEETKIESDSIKPQNEFDSEIGEAYFEEETKLLELEDNPFEEENEDFLGWLSSIKLKEI